MLRYNLFQSNLSLLILKPSLGKGLRRTWHCWSEHAEHVVWILLLQNKSCAHIPKSPSLTLLSCAHQSKRRTALSLRKLSKWYRFAKPTNPLGCLTYWIVSLSFLKIILQVELEDIIGILLLVYIKFILCISGKAFFIFTTVQTYDPMKAANSIAIHYLCNSGTV